MITTMINGRKAFVTYLNSSFEPVAEDVATLVKVIFEDGEVVFLTPAPKSKKT